MRGLYIQKKQYPPVSEMIEMSVFDGRDFDITPSPHRPPERPPGPIIYMTDSDSPLTPENDSPLPILDTSSALDMNIAPLPVFDTSPALDRIGMTRLDVNPPPALYGNVSSQ